MLMQKYGMIIGGIVLLVIVAGALVWSQSKQGSNPSGEITVNVIGNQQGSASLTPTQSLAQAASAKNQIELSVVQPINGSMVTTSSILVTGKTNPNAEVSVNDKDTTADVNGKFTANINLDEGENTIVVAANDSDGNSAEQELTVNYNVPE